MPFARKLMKIRQVVANEVFHEVLDGASLFHVGTNFEV